MDGLQLARCNPTQPPLGHGCLQHGQARMVFTDIAQRHRFRTGQTVLESVSAQNALAIKEVSSRLSKHQPGMLTLARLLLERGSLWSRNSCSRWLSQFQSTIGDTHLH